MTITTGNAPAALSGGSVGKLTTRARKALPGSDFALSGRRYPVNDANHARNALARVAQHGSPAEKAAVRRKVHAKYPSIGQHAHHPPAKG